MRRTHLRGHTNILKRVLLHAGALNLGVLLRTLCGVGTPRALQGRLSVLLGCVWSLIRFPEAVWTHLWTLFRPSALAGTLTCPSRSA
jgi:transposase